MASEARARARHRLIDVLTELSDDGSSGQRAVLVNSLYDLPVDAVEEALLQVAHTCITHAHAPTQAQLRRFLLHLAGRSLHLALRLSWVVDAVAGVFTAAGLGDRVQDLKDSIENVAVNRGVTAAAAPSPAVAAAAAATVRPTSDVAGDVARKQARLALFTSVRIFTSQLTTMSNALRQVPDKSKRKAELQRQLADVNRFLETNRVIFPLGQSADRAAWVVRIAIEECTVFSSRERAPFLLACEVIRDPAAINADPTATELFTDGGELKPAAAVMAAYAPLLAAARSAAGGGGATTRTRSVDFSAACSADAQPELLRQVFGETAAERRERIRAQSPFGQHPGWDIETVIVKAGDDLRQEELALQLIGVLHKIWARAGLTSFVLPYAAVSTTSDGGLIQCVPDASSIDAIKKSAQVQSLYQFFARAYGGEASRAFSIAQRNFVESMAGYSVASYLLQIKDRHNGNLMLTRAGHLVHIDFGFMFVTSPGGIKFESAPFKLSQELADVMGGASSAPFAYFKVLVFQGLIAARQHAGELLALIEMMTHYNTLQCFGQDPAAVVEAVRARLRLDLATDVEFAVHVKDLVQQSFGNWRTKRYDQFQTLQNGII